MLQIDDLTIRVAGRILLDQATAFIAEGWKVGLVGRNGAGKSTLLRLIIEEAVGGKGSIRLANRARIGHVAQEIAPSPRRLIDVVLDADTERAALLAGLETSTDPDFIAESHMRLVEIDAHSAEARAASVLAGLGFTTADLERPSSEFSGGWRMRAALAGVLVSTPDLLLLDEPTNYLDLEGAAWLETYLKRYPGTVLLVSHDRDMLDRSVTHILALDRQKLSVQPGGYSDYLRRRAEQMAQTTQMAARQDEERKRLQAFVDRFKAKASKARQAQSRVKRLEKMETITVPLADRTTPFAFKSGPTLASPLMQLEDAALGYAAGRPVLNGVSLRLDADDRIAIIGPNGQGKTTLVKSIAARLPLLQGARRASGALRVGYFSQDQLDELRPGATPLDHVREKVPDAPTAQVRSITAQLGFGPEKIETPVQKLSGGEKVRLLLGLIG
ncbi:MAG: ABC transporter ATP-binding protein, partial [Alphaproteobacteria bacterium]|nr:ABC transporter ATP-binding protein [Alphaproteobacteria bacterium]